MNCAGIPRSCSLSGKCFKPQDKHRAENQTNGDSRFGQKPIPKAVGKDQHDVVCGE